MVEFLTNIKDFKLLESRKLTKRIFYPKSLKKADFIQALMKTYEEADFITVKIIQIPSQGNT